VPDRVHLDKVLGAGGKSGVGHAREGDYDYEGLLHGVPPFAKEGYTMSPWLSVFRRRFETERKRRDGDPLRQERLRVGRRRQQGPEGVSGGQMHGRRRISRSGRQLARTLGGGGDRAGKELLEAALAHQDFERSSGRAFG